MTSGRGIDGWTIVFQVVLGIGMIYQVDRARRKEVAVKVMEGKNYNLHVQGRGEESGHSRIYENFFS